LQRKAATCLLWGSSLLDLLQHLWLLDLKRSWRCMRRLLAALCAAVGRNLSGRGYSLHICRCTRLIVVESLLWGSQASEQGEAWRVSRASLQDR